MKKYIVSLLVLLFGLLLAPRAVRAVDDGWQITKFSADIAVSRDAKLTVTETIDVDFNNLERHGIYRDIPLAYKDNLGQSYRLRFHLTSITDSNGRTVPFEDSGWNTRTLKIGDPERTITGEQQYVIKYEIERGIRFLATDELYWNATGNRWPVPIALAQATVTFPDGTTNLKTQCYTGLAGESGADCLQAAGANVATFFASDLAAGEGLTIVAGAPRGPLTAPTRGQNIADTLRDNLSYFFIPLTLLAFLIIWWRKGRDPVSRKTVVPEFAPPENLSPSIMGVLKDERADMLDISVAIIHLASRGFLKIEEVAKKKLIGKKIDYKLVKLKSGGKLSPFDKELLSALFASEREKMLSDLKDKFYTHIAPLKKKLYEEALDKKYFAQNPGTVRGTYIALGILIPTVIIFIAAFISTAVVPAVISSIIILPFAIWFGLSMPRRSAEGAEALRRVLGFRLFINTAERYREKFNEDHNIFSRLLPYAMVFGLTQKWAKAFDGLKVTPPDWYAGQSAFNAIYFSHTINTVSSQMNSTLAASPASSGSSGFGGGSSGGGFGGGGGGSW